VPVQLAWQRWVEAERIPARHFAVARRVRAGRKLDLAGDGTLLLDGKVLEHGEPPVDRGV
jgi:hypothetical protein